MGVGIRDGRLRSQEARARRPTMKKITTPSCDSRGLQTEYLSGAVAYEGQRVHHDPRGEVPKGTLRGAVSLRLEQACPPEYRGAQCAFKDSMIH